MALLVVALAVSTASASLPSKAKPSTSGVVVEEVGKGSGGEKPGIQAGDVILAWLRFPSPPANPEKARGRVSSPFDWDEVVVEQSPRGRIHLSGQRSGKPLVVDMFVGDMRILVRPSLAPDALALYEEGKKLIEKKDLPQGIAAWRQAEAKLRDSGDATSAMWLCYRIAGKLAEARKWEEAHQAYSDAIRKADVEDNRVVSSQIRRDDARTYHRQNDFQNAEKGYLEALKIREGLSPDSIKVAQCLTNLGNLADDRGQLVVARDYHRKSLAISEKAAPGSLLVAACLNNLGIISTKIGDLGAAEDFFKRSFAIKEKLAPDSLDVATSLHNLGIVARNKGDLDLAHQNYERALAIRERLSPGGLDVATTLNNLGNVALDRGDLAESQAYYGRALAIQENLLPGSLAVARTLKNLGIVAENRGDLAAAEGFDKRSLAIRDKLAPGSLDVADSLITLGNLAYYRGDLDSAEQSYRKAHDIQLLHAPESYDTSLSLFNLGNVALDCGDTAAAEDLYRSAMTIREKLAPGGLDVAQCLNKLGEVCLRRGDGAAAESLFKKALDITEKVAPGSLDVAGLLDNLGNLAMGQGDTGRAERCLRQALEYQEKLAPGSFSAAESLHALGLLMKKRGDPLSALSFLQRAVDALEAQKGRLGGGSEAAEAFSAKYADYYRDLIEVQVKLKKLAEAFVTLERFRAQALLRMLAERDLDFSRDTPAELLKEQKRMDFEYDKTQAKITELKPSKDSAEIGGLLKKLLALRENQKEIAEKFKRASPLLASLQYPEPLDLEGAQKVLGPGVLFLSYCVGEDTTHLFALLDGKLELFTIPVSRADLKKDIRFLRKLLTDKNADEEQLSRKAASLYDVLVKPTRGQIKQSRAVLICPDGPLHALPFSALKVSKKKYLIEEKPLSYAISATVLAQLQGAPGEKAHALHLAAFGDPAYPGEQGQSEGSAARGFLRDQSLTPLPATREEVNGICALFPGQVEKFLGDQATEETAKKLGKDVRYIHFACHGLFDERFPLDSGLAFSIPVKVEEGQDNGILQAWEIFEKLRIDADLVTLSACETALGKEMGGEGLIGLTRAFEYAGARSVLSSLWNVSDESTALLMTRFYGYLKEGKPKAEALRLAQLGLISSGKGHHPKSVSPHSSLFTPHSDYSHPFYWAAFVLNGDWR